MSRWFGRANPDQAPSRGSEDSFGSDKDVSPVQPTSSKGWLKRSASSKDSGLSQGSEDLSPVTKKTQSFLKRVASRGSKDSGISDLSEEDAGKKKSKKDRLNLIKRGLGSKDSVSSFLSFKSKDDRKGTRDSIGSRQSGETAGSAASSAGSGKARTHVYGRNRKKGKKKGGKRSTTGSRSDAGLLPGRKGTHLSVRSGWSGRSSMSSEASEESSSESSEEDLANEDWDNLEYANIPLYLREGRIRKEGELVPATEAAAPKMSLIRVDDMGRLIDGSFGGVDPKEEDETDDEGPMQEVHVPVWRAGCGMCCFAIWIFVCICLLMTYVWRYWVSVRRDVQRIVAETALAKAEVGLAEVLTPALQAARTLALAARGGLFNRTDIDPSNILTVAFAPRFLSATAIKYIQALGLTPDMRTMEAREGQMYNTTGDVESRLPLVYKLGTTCMQADRLECLNADSSDRRIKTSDDYGANIGWQNPEWHKLGALGEPLEVEDWHYVYRMSASVNLTESGLPGGFVDMIVGLDVRGLQDVAASSTSPGGSIYICNENGTLLAGSDGPREDRGRRNFVAAPETDDQGDITYMNLFDSAMVWVNAIDKDAFTQGGNTVWTIMDRSHGEEYNGDLIGVGSVKIGTGNGIAPAAEPSLRVVVYAPFELSVKRILWDMALGALVLVFIPVGICGMLTIFGTFYCWWLNAYYKCCGIRCCCCRFSCCRRCCPKEEWEFDWDEDY